MKKMHTLFLLLLLLTAIALPASADAPNAVTQTSGDFTLTASFQCRNGHFAPVKKFTFSGANLEGHTARIICSSFFLCPEDNLFMRLVLTRFPIEHQGGCTEPFRATYVYEDLAFMDRGETTFILQGPAPGHLLTRQEAVDATYQADGMKAHYLCDACGAAFLDAEDQQPVSKHELAIRKYFTMNVCTDGEPIGDGWFMYTPVDLSADGVQTIDLIAGDAHKVGAVTLTVQAGAVTASCNWVCDDIIIREESLMFLTAPEDAEAALPFPFDAPISIAEALGGNAAPLLYIRSAVSYPATDPHIQPAP